MTPRPAKPPRTCGTCRYDNSWHYTDEDKPRAYRCPNWIAAEAGIAAQTAAAEANEQATEAARRIIADAAEQYIEFSANQIRDLLEDAGIPGPVVGAAFTWAATPKAGPLITGTGRRVMSTDPNTRHRIEVWRSLVHRAVRSGAA